MIRRHLRDPILESLQDFPVVLLTGARQVGKSTVGTVTEIHQFLRLLFATVGTQYCPRYEVSVEAQGEEVIAAKVRRIARSGGAWNGGPGSTSGSQAGIDDYRNSHAQIPP